MANKHQLQVADNSVHQIRGALECYRSEHPSAQVDVYRSNPVCIRIRVVDPDFHDLDRVEREERVWNVLEGLPGDVRRDISVLLAITPGEMETSGMNLEFEYQMPRVP
ncbi:MAG: hypothetical protein P4L84_15470 [Isosphaeraceae bacterium]|nr:hypothetical protein [Isosphaeraceae bacterium]